MTVGSRNVLGALRQLAFVWLSASLRLGVVGGFVHAGEFKMNVRKVIDQIWREGGAAFATDPQLIRNWTFRPGQGRLVISNATGSEGELPLRNYGLSKAALTCWSMFSALRIKSGFLNA